jgi:hypothetical protein
MGSVDVGFRSFRFTGALPCVAAVAFLSCACGGPTGGGSAEPTPAVRVRNWWVLETVEGQPVGETLIRVEFAAGSVLNVEGPCHHTRGQYSLTNRGADIRALEI